MIEEGLVQLISSVGFPIAITIYLLLSSKKTDKVIENNTVALGEIKGIMLNCKERRDN